MFSNKLESVLQYTHDISFYIHMYKCLGQADVADCSSGKSGVDRFNSCGACGYKNLSNVVDS